MPRPWGRMAERDERWLDEPVTAAEMSEILEALGLGTLDEWLRAHDLWVDDFGYIRRRADLN